LEVIGADGFISFRGCGEDARESKEPLSEVLCPSKVRLTSAKRNGINACDTIQERGLSREQVFDRHNLGGRNDHKEMKRQARGMV
jgi:hypothetical protein